MKKIFVLPEDVFCHIVIFLSFAEYMDLSLTFPFLVSQSFLDKCFMTRVQRYARCVSQYDSYFYVPVESVCVRPQMLSKKLKVTYTSFDPFVYMTLTQRMLLQHVHDFEDMFPCRQHFPYFVATDDTKVVVCVGSLFYTCGHVTLNSVLDVMDSCGIWYEGRVVHREENRVKIRFLGWSSKWDAWYDLTSPCLAPRYTFTTPWRDSIHVGDDIEYKAHTRWFRAHVVECDRTHLHIRYRHDEIVIVSRTSEHLAPVGMHSPPFVYRTTYFCINHTQWKKSRHGSHQPLYFITYLRTKTSTLSTDVHFTKC